MSRAYFQGHYACDTELQEPQQSCSSSSGSTRHKGISTTGRRRDPGVAMPLASAVHAWAMAVFAFLAGQHSVQHYCSV